MRHYLDQKRNERPKIYTFLCTGVDDECTPIYSLEDKLITEWANVWINAGWDPVVLTEKDARKYPQYKEYTQRLKNSKLPSIRWYRYLRYMAMCMQDDGGWYADPSVIPLYPSDSYKGFELPHEGKFTTHYGNFPYLLSANNEGWNAIASAIINDYEFKTDVALISTLHRNSPDMLFSTESIINAKHALDVNLKSIVNCTTFDSKLATLLPELNMDSSYTQKDYYEAMNEALRECHPVIYTFYEKESIDKWTEEQTPTDLNGWRNAWRNAGWHPVVLQLKDAKRHPKFKELKEILDNSHIRNLQHEKMCFYRWLAVAAAGGGWMSDYDIYPLHADPTVYGHKLPNNGKLTSHCSYSPCIVSGSENEWNRIIPLMMHTLKKRSDKLWSDMFATRNLIHLNQIIGERNYGKYLFQTYCFVPNFLKVNVHEVHNNAFLINDSQSDGVQKTCLGTKRKMAIHFSHFSCSKAVFCDGDRGEALTKWIDHWRETCKEDVDVQSRLRY